MKGINAGQAVVVTARWILVAAGLVFAIWVTDPRPDIVGQLRLELAVLVGLALANFDLTLRVLRGKTRTDWVTYAASAADLMVITFLVLSQGGFPSPLYIFYFPALVAIAVTFAPPAVLAYVAATIVTYGLIGSMGVLHTGDAQALAVRTAMFAAVAYCGQVYARIERDRERGASAPLPHAAATE